MKIPPQSFKNILPKSVKDGKVTQWLTERAHEEGLRPVDVMLTSAQNHQAIKDLIDKIEICEAEKENNKRSQQVHIYYLGIGKIDLE